MIFEYVFISDSLLQFFVEYQDEKTKLEVRNILKIAKNYLKGRAFFDFITTVQWARLFKSYAKHSRLFYAIKILRLKKGMYLLEDGRIKQNV